MPVNIYECRLEDIGVFMDIQKGCVIRRTKMQYHTLICEKVMLGDDCFIGHGVSVANDHF